MKRTVLVAFEVDSHAHPNADNIDVDLTVAQRAVATDEDFADAIRARLDEVYPTDDAYPFVPSDLSVAVVDPEAAALLLDAAVLGLERHEGGDNAAEVEVALLALDELRNERRPEPDGAPCCPDPGCPGRTGECTFPGYAANH